MNCKKKIETQFNNGDLRSAWRGIKYMASINQLPCQSSKCFRVKGVDEAALPNTFNSFFSHFQRPDSVSHAHQLMESARQNIFLPLSAVYWQLQTTHYVEEIYPVIPLPKSKNPTGLNDFRPITLTSLVMKSFERILKDEITFMVQGKLDPSQFAYQEGKGIDNAKLWVWCGLWAEWTCP